MAGNTFGHLFRITTFGESHGGCVGVVIDGCPPNFEISRDEIQRELDRRKPGQSSITSPRKEQDEIHILSGVLDGKTTGTPILLLAYNKDANPKDYQHLKDLYRPGHADFTFQMKYGIRDWKGSGRASARETLGRVAAGSIAKKYLKEKLNIEIFSFVEQVGDIKTDIDINKVTLDNIESNIIRCPDKKIAEKMIKLIESVRDEGDSIGGVVRGVIKNVPVGLGEPVFDKLPADLGKAMLSINAVKGFEIGSGFEGVKLSGSEHNDEFYIDDQKKIRTKTNCAGGTLGGISNGETIHFRVAIKPVSTIRKQQSTININKKQITLNATGRHDPCVLPRAISIIDAMSALVLMDHYLRHKAQNL
ncbi:chorismate synthase [Candidatus Roizmanbacteria bacterium RIFCSPHIGHO2_02_FULL_37_13b]|uniref:Chorismate synthase n=1 Tax=Candidatus Roizmanbacteria bacterium RIFCSPLOWO2_02_FULL_36_11 TaxID=1802071 RepID=A0A1F7JGQ9_9BACT|nr:MAG: chorismate synthase [Candidatus Roizmanbacteria bacterium RIFCSPHIGHO2_02_FULL_37_13b]OGK54746.1 MAG: chorismate synthase [Candidatus Roizmanbacteria bacterium RIFCSPLOWO2_02_FULL_36_11]